MTAVLPSPSPHFDMQSEGNNNASPRPNPRRQHNRPPRQAQPVHNPETQSDSNLPNASTPKPRKTPRQPSQPIQGNRQVNPTTNPRSRPSSGAHVAATPSKPSYAGAAFHASPAPSSLPVPKFFSRSVPSANADAGLQAKLEREGDAPDPRASPGTGLAPRPLPAEAKSPLDMFFNADRQEKARLQSPNNGTRPAAPDSRSQTPARAKDMFMLELDDAQSPEPSQYNTPIPFNRQGNGAASENIPTTNTEDERRAAQTQSLKAFLNITSAEAGATPPQLPLQPVQQQPSYSTPSHNSYQQHPDLLYGNRNLSPMFHAARTPHNATPPHQQPHYASGNYASVYGNQYAASPSKPPTTHGHPYMPMHGSPQPPRSAATGYPPQYGQPRPQQMPSNEANDIQDMEDRMKRMLRMS